MMFPERVTLRKTTSSGVDRYGRPIPGSPAETVAEAWFEPLQGSEDTAAAEQFVSNYWLFLPLKYQSALTGADSVVLPYGLGEWQVRGEVGVQPSGYVIEGFLRAALERVTG